MRALTEVGGTVVEVLSRADYNEAMSVKGRPLVKEEGSLSLEVVEELVLMDPLREREATRQESGHEC